MVFFIWNTNKMCQVVFSPFMLMFIIILHSQCPIFSFIWCTHLTSAMSSLKYWSFVLTPFYCSHYCVKYCNFPINTFFLQMLLFKCDFYVQIMCADESYSVFSDFNIIYHKFIFPIFNPCMLDHLFLAHLSTKCSVSFCDPSMSGVRRPCVRASVRQQFL